MKELILLVLGAIVWNYIKNLQAAWQYKKRQIEDYESRQPRYRVPCGKRLSQVLTEAVEEQPKN